MKIISSVKNLSRHDLIYVYEKIKIGEAVELEDDKINSCTWVIYNTHKIGSLDYFDFSLFGLSGKIKAKINAISLKKYFPFQDLDIEIEPTF